MLSFAMTGLLLALIGGGIAPRMTRAEPPLACPQPPDVSTLPPYVAPTLTVYSRPGCAPCHCVKAAIAKAVGWHVVIIEDPLAARAKGVTSWPTLIRGDTGEKLVGYPGAEQLAEWLERSVLSP